MASLTFQVDVVKGSGSYTLQAKGANLGSSWTDLHSQSGEPASGTFNLATLSVDGVQFVSGSTYTVRILDEDTGFASAEVTFEIETDKILLEDGSYMELETGELILLEQ